jgi:hypothetical protein
MSITQKILTDFESFEHWLVKTNAISADLEILDNLIGDLADLDTAIKTSLVNSTNENTSKIGDLTTLTTTAKSSVVAAINELKTILNSVGDLSILKTSVKTNLVVAINELVNKIGDLADLDTTDKTNIIAAINEALGNIDTVVGDLATLTTTAKTSAVAAINEVKSEMIAGIKEAQLYFDTFPAIKSTATNAIAVAAGSAIINGTKRTWSALTKTAITGYSNGFVYIYLYWNGSAVVIDLSNTAPTFDSSSKEWYLSGNADKRCIGWYVNYTNLILPFYGYHVKGEMKIFYQTTSSPTQFAGSGNVLLADNFSSTQTSLALPAGTSAISLVPIAIATSWYCAITIQAQAAGDDMTVAVNATTLTDADALVCSEYLVRYDNGRTSGSIFRPPRQWITYTSGVQPSVIMVRNAGSPLASIECWGAAFRP